MFYSQFILAKKGPLGTIWIAAHLERKLRKNQVADTDIGVSVDSILFPEVPIALRLSSHLLLGVVRIYSRKVNYLFDDCSEALLKVKQAFRSAAVDLPPEESKAPYHSITLPETFDLDDFELPDNEIFQGNYVDHHVSAREQITLQDTMDGVVYSTSQFGLDERFGDGDTSQVVLDLDEEVFQDKDAVAAGEDDGLPGADHDTCLDAATPEIKDSTEGAPEAMPVDCSEDQVEGLAASNRLNEYAQAPQTPGLVEVPSLSSAREELACDDHMEVEDQNASYAAEEVRKASSELDVHQMEKSIKDPSCENNLGQNSDVNMLPDDTDPDKQIKYGGESTAAVLTGDGKIDAQNELEKGRAEHVHVESPCCSHVTTEMEDPGQVMTVPGTHNNDGITEKSEAFASDSAPLMESPGRPTVVDAEHPICQEPDDPGAETRGDDANATGVDQETDSSLRGNVQADIRRIDEQPGNVHATDNRPGNLTGSADSDLPVPEKLLSVPEGLAERENDFMIESTPDKEDVGTAKEDAATKNISGKKRTFTESTLTAESLNSVESVGLIGSRRTADSIPDDDDLLSSILVGRSSFLKMKPTPVLEVVSTKRMRSAPRSTTTKRKVLMDDPMVLHGDVIRQQLMNTEDIRRVRKKAPCTHPEILMLHRQFLENEIFKEPIFAGMSVELVSLHGEPYDLKGIRIVESDEISPGVVKENECSVRPDVVEDGMEESSIPTVSRNDAEEQHAEAHIHPQDQQNKDHETLGHTKDDNELVGDKSETEIDKEDNGAADESNHPVTHEICGMPTGDKNDSAEDLQLDGIRENHDGKVDGQFAEDVSAVVVSNKSCMDPIEVAEGDVENMVMSEMDLKTEDELLQDETKLGASAGVSETEKDRPTPCDDASDPLATGLVEAGSCSHLALENGSEPVGEANNHGPQIGEMESDNKDPACNGVSNEGAETGSACPLEPDVDNKSSIPDDKDNPSLEEADMQSAADVGTASRYCPVGDHADMETTAVEHDTEFLNVDDDEVAEDDDDGAPYGDETRLLENSGWSSRTRAVAKYLQTLFDKEAENGKKVLAVDNLLAGKTRKEASRMFFETLVLKTRDYIQVEQPKPFDSINIKPRTKLMKSVF